MPERYGNSYFLNSYDTTKPLNTDQVNHDLQKIIDVYKKILTKGIEPEPRNHEKFNLTSLKKVLNQQTWCLTISCWLDTWLLYSQNPL